MYHRIEHQILLRFIHIVNSQGKLEGMSVATLRLRFSARLSANMYQGHRGLLRRAERGYVRIRPGIQGLDAIVLTRTSESVQILAIDQSQLRGAQQ